MSQWRLIITDSETLSGVAPVCSREFRGGKDFSVDDCCPQPHLECWSEDNAKAVLELLNGYEVQVCE